MDALFCVNCDNMLVTKIKMAEPPKEDDEESGGGEAPGTEKSTGSTLIRHCRNCNYTIEEPEETKSVYHSNFNLDTIKREHVVNKYTAFDNTLPKAQGIKCPNTNCPVKSRKSDIRYIKYDDNSMKYIYMCLDCNQAGIEPNTW